MWKDNSAIRGRRWVDLPVPYRQFRGSSLTTSQQPCSRLHDCRGEKMGSTLHANVVFEVTAPALLIGVAESCLPWDSLGALIYCEIIKNS